MPELVELVTQLDGHIDPAADGVYASLQAIALPPLFRNDLDDYLEISLLQRTLSLTEQSFIANRDEAYISRLREVQRRRAQSIQKARAGGTLADELRSDAARTYRDLCRAKEEAERLRLTERLRADVVSESSEPDLRLSAFLDATMEQFIWRPIRPDRVSGYLSIGNRSLDHIGEVVGIALDETSTFMEVAYYWGISYSVFGNDPSMSIIKTDHEVAWETNEVFNMGPPATLLADFLSISEIVDIVASCLAEDSAAT